MFAAEKNSVNATSLNESPNAATNGIISTAGNGGNDTYQRPSRSTQSFRLGGRETVSASWPWRKASAW